MKAKERIKQLEDALRLASVRLGLASAYFGSACKDPYLKDMFAGFNQDARDAIGIPRWYHGDILTKYSDGSNKCAFPDYRTEM